MAHVGLMHRDPCGCKVKGFRAVSSIVRNVSKRHLQGVRHDEGLKFRLEEEYDMSDLGELHFFLRVYIERDRAARIITMHQKSYIEEVLKRFGMEDCKPISTPLDVKAQLVKFTWMKSMKSTCR